VFSVLVIGPKVRRFAFSRAIVFRTTLSFGGEVNPSFPYRKILRHVTLRSMKEIISKAKFIISFVSSSAFLLCDCW
jgi:hypothetical protein